MGRSALKAGLNTRRRKALRRALITSASGRDRGGDQGVGVELRALEAPPVLGHVADPVVGVAAVGEIPAMAAGDVGERLAAFIELALERVLGVGANVHVAQPAVA